MSSSINKIFPECSGDTLDVETVELTATVVRDDESDATEWRIPTTLGAPSTFHGRQTFDFTNPRTGEAFLPIQVYVKFVRGIEQAANVTFFKLAILLICLKLFITWILAWLDELPNLPIHTFWGAFLSSLILVLFTFNTVANAVFNTRDSRVRNITVSCCRCMTATLDINMRIPVVGGIMNPTFGFDGGHQRIQSVPKNRHHPTFLPRSSCTFLFQEIFILARKSTTDKETWTVIKDTHKFISQAYRSPTSTMFISLATWWLVMVVIAVCMTLLFGTS